MKDFLESIRETLESFDTDTNSELDNKISQLTLLKLIAHKLKSSCRRHAHLISFKKPITLFIACGLLCGLIEDAIMIPMLANDLRAAIGLVSQDVYLIDGTIAENITYGTFSASGDAIIEAAQMAQAHDFIMALPQGYNTKVQEHGKNLSGGQRQRLAIARAIMKKSPILIFDEATSAIDNETETAIQQSIAKLSSDHTIIIIAHRLSTVCNADIIFVLEKGVIIESGNHEALLKTNGALR